jgi:hypothetical protein
MHQPTLGILLLTATLIRLSTPADAKPAQDPRGSHRLSSLDKSEVAAELTGVVEAFITAGERNDPNAH